MIKFPYIEQYKFLEREDDIRPAEEILREYNDFFLYNQSHLAEVFRKVDVSEEDVDTDDPVVMEKLRQRAELNVKAVTDEFARLFGSKDFAKSVMVGLKISWDDIQKILLEEYRKKTVMSQSSMQHIAPRLRALASLLLFAEYLYSKLDKYVDKGAEKVQTAKQYVELRFTEALVKMGGGQLIEIPEFSNVKVENALGKLRNVDAVVEYVKVLLG